MFLLFNLNEFNINILKLKNFDFFINILKILNSKFKTVKGFAQKKVNLPIGLHKLIILDEADSLTDGA